MHWSQKNTTGHRNSVQDCLDSKLPTHAGSASSALCPSLDIPDGALFLWQLAWKWLSNHNTILNRSKTDYLWRHSSARQVLVKRCCVVQMITRSKLELVFQLDRQDILLQTTSRRHNQHASIVPSEEEAREVNQKRAVWNKSERWDLSFFRALVENAMGNKCMNANKHCSLNLHVSSRIHQNLAFKILK